MVCMLPIVNHIMMLQSIKQGLTQRANVRKVWSKAVGLHASKKATLQRAYDNPKTSADTRQELEDQVHTCVFLWMDGNKISFKNQQHCIIAFNNDNSCVCVLKGGSR
jgi:hypothetical protein